MAGQTTVQPTSKPVTNQDAVILFLTQHEVSAAQAKSLREGSFPPDMISDGVALATLTEMLGHFQTQGTYFFSSGGRVTTFSDYLATACAGKLAVADVNMVQQLMRYNPRLICVGDVGRTLPPTPTPYDAMLERLTS